MSYTDAVENNTAPAQKSTTKKQSKTLIIILVSLMLQLREINRVSEQIYDKCD